MRINIYNQNFELVANIGESFVSCLWSEGYNTVESFTLELIATERYKKKIKTDMYVKRIDRDNVMVIKSIQQQGNKLIISGKQATRVFDDVVFVGSLPKNSVIDTAVLEAYNKSNGYPNTEYASSELNDKYGHQISNKTILELLEVMCQAKNIGFKAFKKNNKLNFGLYKPDNAPIKFSNFFGNAKFDNVTNSVENFKNYAIVLGEGEGDDRIRVDVDLTKGSKRRELLVDAKDVQREEEESDEEYTEKLEARGVEKLLEKTKVFSIDVVNLPKGFGKDYDLGYNVLVVIPEYDLSYSTRITKFSEKSQQNRSDVSVTFGELIKVKR
jgi:hypothetical protein